MSIASANQHASRLSIAKLRHAIRSPDIHGAARRRDGLNALLGKALCLAERLHLAAAPVHHPSTERANPQLRFSARDRRDEYIICGGMESLEGLPVIDQHTAFGRAQKQASGCQWQQGRYVPGFCICRANLPESPPIEG